jgi:hypothetical protein
MIIIKKKVMIEIVWWYSNWVVIYKISHETSWVIKKI